MIDNNPSLKEHSAHDGSGNYEHTQTLRWPQIKSNQDIVKAIEFC